ncbi:MAG TPA: protein translocase subunit SecD [Candidatus Dormibacteraeota bacterium]|nr:protein translocase subunit SecD [Candidatus Dormibacteraeota bacterium]
MRYLVNWPARIIVIALVAFSAAVATTGYALPPRFSSWQATFHKGLDLAGGARMELQLTNFPPGRDRATLEKEEIAILQKRVNALGVSEPVVSAEGTNDDRILVELAGVSLAQAQQAVGKTDRLVYTTWMADSTVTNGIEPGQRPQLTNLTGANVTNANAVFQTGSGGIPQWVVAISFDPAGADLFGKLTTTAGAATGTPQNNLGIWLDLTQSDVDNWNANANQLSLPPEQGGKLVTNPTTSGPILGGQAQIQGNFTQATATALATSLNEGALPVDIVSPPLSTSQVSASLGAQAVKQSLGAGALGLAIVIIFMIAFYRLPGLLASIALLGYASIMLTLFKVIPVTLTLAGLAAFVLSVGMAVDANVLIFERFKEELRAGRTVAAAAETGVRRAWPAIRDSNISTGISATVLYIFGTGQVQGFALTLFVGVLVSMFSSIVITQNLLAVVLAWRWTRKPAALGVEGSVVR